MIRDLNNLYCCFLFNKGHSLQTRKWPRETKLWLKKNEHFNKFDINRETIKRSLYCAFLKIIRNGLTDFHTNPKLYASGLFCACRQIDVACAQTVTKIPAYRKT